MKAKKILAVLLVAALAVTSFAACSSNEKESSSKDESSTSSSTESSSNVSEEDAALIALGGKDADGKYWDGETEISAPGEIPIVLGDKIEISAFTAPHKDSCAVFDYGVNTFTTKLEDDTNIHIDWTVVTQADKTAKLNLLFQSNNYEDLIFSSWFDGASTYTYAEQGYLAPLSIYFDTQGYYYLEWYDALIESGAATEQAMKSAYMPDGNLYSFTLLNDAFNAKYAVRLWIYQPWLDTLGLEMPTTTEEFEAVLKAFKTKDPNGNGKADEIPLTGSYSTGWFADPTEHLMNSFVYYQKSDKILVEDGKPTMVYTTDGYRQGVEWLNSLCSQGLLAADLFTQDNTMLISSTTQDVQLVGVTAGGLPSNFTRMTNNEHGDWTNWTTVPPLEGPEGVRYCRYSSSYPNSRINMTTNCEYPIATFKLLDYLTEKEVAMNAVFGQKGEWWDYAEEGEIGLDGKQAIYTNLKLANAEDTGDTNFAWQQIGHSYSYPGWHTGQTVVGDPTCDMESILYASAVTYEPYTPPMEMIMPPVIFDEADSKDVASYKATLVEIVDAYFADAIVNGYSDEGWDAFQANLEAAGVNELHDLYQKGYDDYLQRIS